MIAGLADKVREGARTIEKNEKEMHLLSDAFALF